MESLFGEGSAGHAASLSRELFFCDSKFKVREGGGTEAISESPKYIYACEIRAMCPREIARSRLLLRCQRAHLACSDQTPRETFLLNACIC